MSFKVAVASSDGKFINQHFGKATQFLIFEIKDHTKYKFLETRSNDPACDIDGHTENAMMQTVKLLSDCEAVLASQIGPGAVDTLLKNNINPYIAPMFIDDALKEIGEILANKKE
ncbi:MAG: NifB/NifX family molybdenum-iron cluster-binding protein [Methanobacteriaceae archaeon]